MHAISTGHLTRFFFIADNQQPTVTPQRLEATVEGCAASEVPVAATTVTAFELLGFAVSDNCTADADLRVTSRDASTGTCPIIVTRNYTVIDACGLDNSFDYIFYVNDNVQPTVTPQRLETTVEGCAASTVPAANTVADLELLGFTVSDNCTTDASMTVTSADVVAGSCPIVITRTYTVADACGNSVTLIHTIVLMSSPSRCYRYFNSCCCPGLCRFCCPGSSCYCRCH